METIFAVLLGILALWALWSAIKGFRASTIVGVGFLVIAICALWQILNITGAYSLIVSIITTLGIVVGYVLTRRRPVPRTT